MEVREQELVAAGRADSSPPGRATVIPAAVGWQHSQGSDSTAPIFCSSIRGSGLLLLPVSGLFHFVQFGFLTILPSV